MIKSACVAVSIALCACVPLGASTTIASGSYAATEQKEAYAAYLAAEQTLQTLGYVRVKLADKRGTATRNRTEHSDVTTSYFERTALTADGQRLGVRVELERTRISVELYELPPRPVLSDEARVESIRIRDALARSNPLFARSRER